MELRHYIDGVLVEEPTGWGEFTEDYKRDYKSRMIGTEYPIDVVFTGGAYAHLSALYDAAPCDTVTYVVEQECGEGFVPAVQCAIVLADIEFNLDRCLAKVKATDDGIGARISNNAKVVVKPGAVKSKTGTPIEVASPISISVFDPSVGTLNTFLPDARRMYDWKAAMRHCVSYITDLNVGLVSDWYDALPDMEKYAIVDGLELRLFAGAEGVSYTFDELFNELGKKHNLWASAERDINGVPFLRIEPESYFYGAPSGISLPQTRDLTRKVDQERLYSNVKVGSDQYIKDMVGGYSLPFLSLRGFVEESFSFKCGCNTDNELDLVNKWVIDTNVFEDVLANNEDKYDERIFLVQYTESTGEATQGTYLNAGIVPGMYNEELQNFKTLQRWSLFCSIGLDSTVVVNTHFKAKLDAADIVVMEQIEGVDPLTIEVNTQATFDNDYDFEPFPDPGNDYGNGTAQGSPVALADSRYTAPAQGFYSFTTQVLFRVQLYGGPAPVAVTLRMETRRYSPGNVLLYTSPYVEQVTNTSEFITLLDYPTLSLDTGDYVAVFLYIKSLIVPSGGGIRAVQVTLLTGGTLFQLDGSTIGGNIEIPFDADDFYGTIYSFERHATLEDWGALVADHTLSVAVGAREEVVRGYPFNCSRNLKTGATKWQLIANRTQ